MHARGDHPYSKLMLMLLSVLFGWAKPGGCTEHVQAVVTFEGMRIGFFNAFWHPPH